MAQLDFLIGVSAYLRVCFRMPGVEEVDLADFPMAADRTQRKRGKPEKLRSHVPAAENMSVACQDHVSGSCVRDAMSLTWRMDLN